MLQMVVFHRWYSCWWHTKVDDILISGGGRAQYTVVMYSDVEERTAVESWRSNYRVRVTYVWWQEKRRSGRVNAKAGE